MQLEIMANGGVRRQNRRFHRWTIGVREDSIERNLNNVSVIQLNLIVTTGIEESIERLLQLGFELSDNADDLFDRLLVQHTARSVDKQTNVFVKLNVSRKFHYRILGQGLTFWEGRVRSKCRQRGRPEE
jgi:hypothetical protein